MSGAPTDPGSGDPGSGAPGGADLRTGRVVRADDFVPEKNWRVLAASGYMGHDPYTGLPGVEQVAVVGEGGDLAADRGLPRGHRRRLGVGDRGDGRAVEREQGFAMKYQIIERNEKHVRAIQSALKRADGLILATDPDREGEAISWHLLELLTERNAMKDKTVERVVFHEITERAVKEAVAHPRQVATDLVNAQQARRALDYLVGFNLSPLLWRKVAPGLSAGRVQSPALRLICEREEEIKAFIPREYWTLLANADKSGAAFTAKLVELDGGKVEQFTVTEGAAAQAARRA